MTKLVTFKLLVRIKAQPNTEPYYRIYLDKELFTERSFIWDADTTSIRENIAANLAQGIHQAEVRFCNLDVDQIESTDCKIFFPNDNNNYHEAKFNAENCDYSFEFTVD
jgi:hypothetical protein